MPSPTPTPDAWPGLYAMWWEGWDGSVWDLLSGKDGVLLARKGARGLNMPGVTRYTSESPGVHGSRYRGSRVDERSAFWPLTIFGGESTVEWTEIDRRFWNTLRPDKTGNWCVQPAAGGVRRLTLRFDSDSDNALDGDPTQTGLAVYGVSFAAEAPFWRGETVERSFASASTDGFFTGGPGGKGPGFKITSASSFANANITNPGDVAAFPKWVAHGPTSSLTLGIAGQTISVPFAIAAGASVTIDTDPTQLTAITNTGVDRTAELGNSSFASIPPGADVPLTIAMVGAGSVDVSIVPNYYRAW